MRCSVGLPNCRSALKPGVWHTLPVYADHMWAHVDKEHARGAFERLAHCLRLVAEQPDLGYSPPQTSCPGVRRSARLRAKAERADLSPIAAIGRGLDRVEEEAEDLIVTGVCKSYEEDGWIRCNVCAVEGADEVSHDTTVSNRAFGIDDSPCSEAGLYHRFSRFGAAVLVFALVLAGIAFAIAGTERCISETAVAVVCGLSVVTTCPTNSQLIGPASTAVPEVKSASPEFGALDNRTVLGGDL